MLRSIGKQTGESVVSVLKKKREVTVKRTCRKGRFYNYLMSNFVVLSIIHR